MDVKYGKNVSEDFIRKKIDWGTGHYVKLAKKYSKLSVVKQEKCYVCSGKKRKIVGSFYGINYVQCKKCNLVYTDRRLSYNDLEKFYQEDERIFHEVYTKKSRGSLKKNIFIPKIKFIKKYTKGKNWLDVGSAEGTAVAEAKSAGFHATGIELSKIGRQSAKKNHNITLYERPLETFSLENKEKWNVISYFCVLPHLTNPINAVKLSYNLLDDEGIIAVELPNYNSVSTYVQKLSKVPDRHLYPLTHLMIFTLDSAKYILEKNGFEPIAVWFLGMDMIELLKHIARLDKAFEKSELHEALIKKLNKLQFTLDKEGLGDEFLIIAKRIKNFQD